MLSLSLAQLSPSLFFSIFEQMLDKLNLTNHHCSQRNVTVETTLKIYTKNISYQQEVLGQDKLPFKFIIERNYI